MKILRRELLALLPAAAFLCGLALAQDASAPTANETAEALLARVAETYKALDRFYFSAVEQTRTHSENFDRRTESEYVVAADSSGRARMQLTDQASDSVSVFDGETSWFHVPKMGQYIEHKRDPFAPARSGRGDALPFDIHKSASRYIQRYSGVADRLERARITHVKAVDEPRGKVNYVVVEAGIQDATGNLPRQYSSHPLDRPGRRHRGE